MMTIEDKKTLGKLKQYINAISRVCQIKAVYLFGSSVHNDNIETSDIDLAIISDAFGESNFIEYLSKFLLISAEHRLNIEPHLFRPEDLDEDFVSKEIVSRGIKLLPSAA